MQTTLYAPPALATTAGDTRTITMGRNRLNSIENWVKPPKPSKSRAVQAAQAERALAEQARPLENGSTPRPVSQFVRTTTLAAPR